MFIIPGFLIGWATFPGVIIHEFAHKKSCDWRGIAVRDVDYFSWSGRGYVTHRSPRQFSDTLAISAAPFVVNTLIAFALYLMAILLLEGGGALSGAFLARFPAYAAVAIGWLAVSVGWHAIPSFTDSGNIWRGVKANWRSSNLALFSIPLVLLFYIGNILAFFWFDAIYSLGIGALAYALVTSGVI